MTFPDEHGPNNGSAGNVDSDGAPEAIGLEAALSEARVQAEQAREQQLRAFAELENFRKRSLRDVEQARKFALERFAGELIGVKDSLEMALAANSSNADGGKATGTAVLAGVEATLKLLSAAFEKAGVTEVVPTGEVFNPEFHEAMVAQPSTELPPNSVLQVVQKGYLLNGRLLRPARVIVSREP
jgi:molecular chaperone GrpE